MKVLGITGGVGSGKSQVLAYLETRYHASVCQMDEVAKQLQREGNVLLQGNCAGIWYRDNGAGRRA